jgi:signal transduction histidine kinase
MTRLAAPRMSFRRVLMVALLTPMFLVAVTALWLMASFDADALRRYLADATVDTARLVGDYSSSSLAFNTPRESTSALALLEQDPRVVAVALYDARGALFSSWVRPNALPDGVPSRLPLEVTRPLTREIPGAVEAWRPVTQADERYGTVYLRTSTAEIEARKDAHLVTLLLLGLMLVGLGFLVAAIAQRVISQPILRLSSAAEQIALKRDYGARIPVGGAREIRTLTASLNGMLAAIEQHQRERDAAVAEVGRHAENLERRVRERTADLEASNRELEAFSYSVSHDLRAPLRAIQGFGRLLLEEHAERLDDEGRDFVNRITRAAERMDRLILDLLEYGRLGKKAAEIESIELDAVIDDALRQVADLVAERGADMQVAAPLGRVRGHHATLVQALANLLSNAVKFVENGNQPVVRISARRPEPGSVRLEIVDNGIGIAREHQERVFQLFERLHDTARYAGTGVGLAIVKRAVERMGGRVGVVSEVGRGSTFWIDLPVA